MNDILSLKLNEKKKSREYETNNHRENFMKTIGIIHKSLSSSGIIQALIDLTCFSISYLWGISI
jgi:hypothetical protein